MLNNFIAAKLHKRKCYKRIKPKAIKQAYLGLFLALSWSLCHSIHRASGETRRIFWWKYRMGFMRGRIIVTVCAVTFCDMIGIFNLVSKSSVTAFACVGMFLCLMDFDTIFWFCFICTNFAFKYFLILDVRWWIVGLCFTYKSFKFTVFFNIKIFFINFFR